MRHKLFRTALTGLVVTAVLGTGSTAAFADGASDELGGAGTQHGAGFCSAPNRDYTNGTLHGIQVPEGCHWGD